MSLNAIKNYNIDYNVPVWLRHSQCSCPHGWQMDISRMNRMRLSYRSHISSDHVTSCHEFASGIICHHY